MKMVLLCTSDRMVEPSLIYIYINITKIYKIYILYTRGTHTSLIYRHRGYILKILVILLRDFYRLVIPRVKQRTKTYKKLLYSCYFLVIFCDEVKNEVILLKIDMLEVKKDRVKEIDKQLRKISKIKKSLKSKNYMSIGFLKNEKKTLLQEIEKMESKRGELHGEKALCK